MFKILRAEYIPLEVDGQGPFYFVSGIQDWLTLRNYSKATISAYGCRQTINGDYSALQKFYKHVLQQEWWVDHLPRPRKSYPAPKPVQRLVELRQKAYLESV